MPDTLDKKAFGQRLGQLLEQMRERGWPRQRIAEEIGVSVQTLNNWRSGRHIPKPHHMAALALLTGLTVPQLWETFRIQEPANYPQLSSDQEDRAALLDAIAELLEDWEVRRRRR